MNLGGHGSACLPNRTQRAGSTSARTFRSLRCFCANTPNACRGHSRIGCKRRSALSISSMRPPAFTVDQSGCGQALAFNVVPDGSLKSLRPNGRSNGAWLGDYVRLLGVGSLLSGPHRLMEFQLLRRSAGLMPVILCGGLHLDAKAYPAVEYGGVAPGLIRSAKSTFKF